MTQRNSHKTEIDAGLESLLALPVVPAPRFEGWGLDTTESPVSPPDKPVSPFEHEREYRYCKAVVQTPFKSCSQYPALAGMSTKTALPIRRKLVARGFIRERIVSSGGRGRSTILLEPTQEGTTAVAQHEDRGATS